VSVTVPREANTPVIALAGLIDRIEDEKLMTRARTKSSVTALDRSNQWTGFRSRSNEPTADFDRLLWVRAVRAAASGIVKVEGFLCTLFSAVILLVGGIAAAAAVGSLVTESSRINLLEKAALVAWASSWTLLDLPYMLRLMLTAIRHDHPIPLNAAIAQRTPPPVLRPLVSAWWLAHFSVGAWMAAGAHAFSHRQNPMRWLVFIAAVGLGFCANGFLMLTVCAATPSARARSIVWRSRALIDVAIGLLGALVVERLIRK
jgi:hypothetical protein